MATKRKKEAEDIKREEFTCSLKVSLTDVEVADRADRAAQKLAERDNKEEEVKAAAKHNKAIIESLEAELRRLSNEVRTKATYSEVNCERQYDYGRGVVREVRLDTDEVVHERDMTAQEKQRELPFEANGEA